MTYLIAPTEPPQIKTLGITSSVPEQVGVDILWTGKAGLAGCQRKTVSDLIASVRDNRLGKELEQMQRLTFRGLIVEGTPQWTRDGELLEGRSRWTKKMHQGVLIAAQLKGVVVLGTRDHLDTLDAITQLAEWSLKEEGVSSMLYRGNSKGDEWGTFSHRSTGVHFLSGAPGLGVELAGRIYDTFGCVPLKWSVSKEELMKVKGLGKKKVEQLMKVLPGE